MIIHHAMKRFLFFLLLYCLLLLILAGCGTNASTPTPPVAVDGTPTPFPTGDSGSTPAPESTSEDGGIGLDGIVGTVASELDARTPVPTPTPDFLDREANQIASETGLGGFTFLGLMGADWISLFISIIIFFIGYVVLTRLFYRLLKRVVQRTKTTFDDEFLQTVGPDIERLVGLFVLRFAIQRLSFMSIPIRGLIDDITYILGLIFVVIICLKLVNFTATWYRKFVQPKEKKADQLDPVIALLQHVSYAFIIMVGFLIGLVHFGVDVSIFTGILLIVGLGVVLGARAIVADLVAGFIILAGRPFRVGDAIQLQEWPEYGFVEEIGTRATQVRTIDNRAVIVRNSVAINDQIVNYSTPDSTVMVKTHVRIAYHADLNQIRKLITDTVQGIEGVLPDKPINILYREFGESARLILVRWWIADFDKEYYIVDDVNSAIEAALNEAGFNIPYSTLDLNLNQIEELRQMMSGPKSRTDDTDS